VNREAAQEFLSAGPLDVLIVGGGIVGASVARDAAMRGLRTGLIDQFDFAFGTSSRSSRLLHGGIRYLAQGRIGLVREASLEKKVLHRIAPHLALPLPFVFPTYRQNRHWKLWQLAIGVKIYDLLCGRNLGKSSWLGAKQTTERIPGLSDDGLRGAVRYFDGLTNDARLVLDTLRSAEQCGAGVVNYAELTTARRDKDWICDVQVNSHTGNQKPLMLRAKTVVNATGPWADGLPNSAVKLRLTKGIHLVVDRTRLSVPDAVVMTEESRVLFVIPWGERTIIGTTDTDYDGPLDQVFANAADIDYVLRITNRFFPRARLSTDDIISTWAGLRPLVADRKGGPSDISRSHQIKNPQPGWWDVAGGKLTTCRLMAEQTVDRLVFASKLKSQPCRTAVEPLMADKSLSGIVPPPVSRAIVEYFCLTEWVQKLTDLMIRRTSWHYYHRDPMDLAMQILPWISQSLGWGEQRQQSELAEYKFVVDRRLG
jgi:glycerol-3-phosphate dehydrogenase